jgi:hypothetical protein
LPFINSPFEKNISRKIFNCVFEITSMHDKEDFLMTILNCSHYELYWKIEIKTAIGTHRSTWPFLVLVCLWVRIWHVHGNLPNCLMQILEVKPKKTLLFGYCSIFQNL